MKISNEGLELIKRYEGLKLKAYKAHPNERFFTIGYGHYGADVTENQEITGNQAEVLLLKDVEKFETFVNYQYKNFHLKQNEFDALVSLSFNAGTKAVSQTLFKLITNKADKETIFMWWSNHYITCGSVVLKGLQKRRAEEAKLFTR